MGLPRTLVSGLRALFRGRQLDQEMDEELGSYLDSAVEDKMRSGMNHADALRAARVEIGSLDAVKQQVWSVGWESTVESIWQDLRFGVRQLRKHPGFTLTAVLILALGIGTNLAIFSVANALFFKPLPVHDPDQLVWVYGRGDGRRPQFASSYAEYSVFRDHSRSFSVLAAGYFTAPLNITVDGDSQMVSGAVVSANYFALLEVHPIMGRFFLPEEDRVPDRDAVAVISYGLWKRRFGGNEAVLGRDISINGRSFKVVGIAPPSFRGALPGIHDDLWIPLMMLRLGYRWCDGFTVCTPLDLVGRLVPSRTPAAAEAELTGMMQYSDWNRNRKGMLVVPAVGADEESKSGLREQFRLLISGSGVLLLIACANLSGLCSFVVLLAEETLLSGWPSGRSALASSASF